MAFTKQLKMRYTRLISFTFIIFKFAGGINGSFKKVRKRVINDFCQIISKNEI